VYDPLPGMERQKEAALEDRPGMFRLQDFPAKKKKACPAGPAFLFRQCSLRRIAYCRTAIALSRYTSAPGRPLHKTCLYYESGNYFFTHLIFVILLYYIDKEDIFIYA
jgi:hypothetical protein